MRFVRSNARVRLRAAVLAASLVAGLVVVVAPPAGVAAAAVVPAMTAVPAAGMSGDQVVLTGTGCGAPGTPIDLIFLNSTAGAVAGHATLDDSGSFTATVTVPWGVAFLDRPRYGNLLTPGDFQFVAFDRSVLPPVCQASFHVTQSVALALSASPVSGPAGSTVHVSLACFEPWQVSVSVSAEVDGVTLPGTSPQDFVAVGPAPGMPLELFDADIVLPADLAVGTEVQLVGRCTSVDLTPATFVVTASTTTVPPPATVAAAVAAPAAFTG